MVCINFSIRKLKKFYFRNILNHFFSEKFISWIYDIEHYKHFFRDHNNLVIPKKKEKYFKKNIFHHHQNFIFTSKVKRRRSIDSKGILKQRNIKETRSNGIKLNSSKFSNSSYPGNLFYYSNSFVFVRVTWAWREPIVSVTWAWREYAWAWSWSWREYAWSWSWSWREYAWSWSWSWSWSWGLGLV